jgi:hypothetical protein
MEQQQDDQKKAERKRKQAEAWKKWNASPKGAAYRQRQKERRILGPRAEETNQ